jgi:ferrous iron transport protein B
MENCHGASAQTLSGGRRIALVGNPNVGKSVLFHRLTGRYVVVSNYPGTTVELSQGSVKTQPDLTVVDTPGIIAFPPRTEDEQVTARVLVNDAFQAIVQVGDAKNFRRTLHLTLQLAEMGAPMLLVLNMMDEAEAHGLQVDTRRLTDWLDIPVIPTIATRRQGMQAVEDAIPAARQARIQIHYPAAVERALAHAETLLPETQMSQRALGLLWLSEDSLLESWLADRIRPAHRGELEQLRDELRAELGEAPAEAILRSREELVNRIAGEVVLQQQNGRAQWAQRFSRMTTHPIWGLPVLALALYGMYWFVGVFGAGTLVELLEARLFGEIVNPWFTGLVQTSIPISWLADLIVGPYGLWTMGMTYAVALLLPIVATFFITFGVLEDSGYLPRLAVLSNRIFRIMGLNGRAVLPMVLGLGCVTMATMTTRILTSKRDRLLVIFLLALAIPCSAQLGVVLGMLAGISLGAALIWGGVVLAVLLAVGWLAARLMPGERSPLVVELPPLRLPVLSNVIMKTLARMEWYIKEAVPLFLFGTLLLFALDRLHVLPWLIQAGEPLVTGWLGLPAEAASAFLLGFLRRDFAATGLFAMQSAGMLNDQQVVVAIVTITLFIPCIASTFMIGKERGTRTALAMFVLIIPFAFLVGGLLRIGLGALGWGS